MNGTPALRFANGDVTKVTPNEKPIVIPHICNDEGKWGAGVSGSIGKAFPEAEKHYRSLDRYVLGTVDVIKGGDNLFIANMIAQHSIGSKESAVLFEPENSPLRLHRPPIRYGALSRAMRLVRNFCYADGKPWCTIHAPRFGTALAGGNWETIQGLINEMWLDDGIEVTIYNYAK